MNSVLAGAVVRVAERRHHSFAEAIDAVLDELVHVMPMGAVFLVQPSEEGSLVRIMGSRGERIAGLDQDQELRPEGEGAVPDPEPLRELGVESFVAVPLESSEGHQVGSLCAAGTESDLYHEDHLDLLTVLARLLAREAEVVRYRAELQRLIDSTRDRTGTHPLTGLADRATLLDALRRELALNKRGTHSSVLLTCRLDGVQEVKSEHGAAMADLVVKDAAETLRGVLREADICAQVATDMLAGVLVGCETTAQAEIAAERYRAVLTRVAEARPARIKLAFGYCTLESVDKPQEALNSAESEAMAVEPAPLDPEEALA